MKHPTPTLIAVLIGVQVLCAVFFIGDVIGDILTDPGGGALYTLYMSTETIASLALVIAIFVEVSYLRRLLREREQLAQKLSVAGSAIEDIVETLFHEWELSPAERDVGRLLVKGLSISEIAELRGNADGTIKAHLNALYRKSGARNRAEVLSIVVDAVMGRDAAAQDENRAAT